MKELLELFEVTTEEEVVNLLNTDISNIEKAYNHLSKVTHMRAEQRLGGEGYELQIYSSYWVNDDDSTRQYEICIDYDCFTDEIDEFEDFISKINTYEAEAQNLLLTYRN